MNTVTVELDIETVENLVRKELEGALDGLKSDLSARKEDRGIAIFSEDKEEDIQRMEASVSAFERVLEFY